MHKTAKRPIERACLAKSAVTAYNKINEHGEWGLALGLNFITLHLLHVHVAMDMVGVGRILDDHHGLLAGGYPSKKQGLRHLEVCGFVMNTVITVSVPFNRIDKEME